MIAINDRIDDLGWRQTVTAANVGISQPRVSSLRRCRLSEFSLDALVRIGMPLGVTLTVTTRQDSH